MKLNPYKQLKFYIDKNTGMLKAHVPVKIKDEVNIEIDDYQLSITIK